MNLNKIVCALIFASAFAVNANAQSRPDWVDNPGKTFFNQEIYAVGSGKTLNEAQSDARANIVKFFETNVNSKFQSAQSGSNNSFDNLSRAEIEETSRGIIKGINITKVYQGKDAFYALAVLDKERSVKEILYDIDQLDAKMRTLLDSGDAKNAAQLERMYLKREELNRKHLFLTGARVTEKVKYDEIFRVSKDAKPLSFYLAFVEDKLVAGNPVIKNKLTKFINDEGFVVAGDIEKADRVITVYVAVQEQYINVSGFRKYKISFRIECKEGSKTIGSIAEEYTETGRTLDQVYERALSLFGSYFDANKNKLIR